MVAVSLKNLVSQSLNGDHASKHDEYQKHRDASLKVICHYFVLLSFLRVFRNIGGRAAIAAKALGPVALRPALSSGLPFSDISFSCFRKWFLFMLLLCRSPSGNASALEKVPPF